MWAATGEPWALPVTVGAGVLVDIDHGPDLWWTFALRRTPAASFVLHAWEWLLGLSVLAFVLGFPWWLVAVCVGYGLHVSTDHLFNRGRPLAYFFFYRALHGFRMARVFTEGSADRAYVTLEKEVPIAVWLIEWWRGRSHPESRSPD